MKTIFNKETREELIRRIKDLNEDCEAGWGKMNVYQMLKHCTIWDEWMSGVNKPVYKQEFIGRIFGKVALNRMVKDDKPLDKNIPTSPSFKVRELSCDLEAEKKKWIELIEGYENYSNPEFIHDFFV